MTATPIAESDVLIVGAGIVGLAHASAALARGLTVTVIDRDARAVGASVRNFGHACVTAQSGELHDLAVVAREKWLLNSERAGFFSVQSGAVTVARSKTELAVLEELSASREKGEVALLTPKEAKVALGVSGDSEVLGGAKLRDDLRVDPREASRSLARWLAAQKGVTILWQTSYQGPDGDLARTSRGPIKASRTIVCVGHDLDYLFPDVAADAEIERCALQMTRVEAPKGLVLSPAVLTGTSMLRYPAFAETKAVVALKAQLQADRPELLEIGANVMFTQRPNGTLIVGDSHRYEKTMDPFNAEKVNRLLLDEIAGILGVKELKVKERWQGIYASSGKQPFISTEVAPNVTAAIVTSGVGMTIGFGLAERTLSSF